MSSIVETIKYNSAKDFLADISYGGNMYKSFNENFIFRGLKSAAYDLIPSILRHKLSAENVGDSKKVMLSGEDIEDSEFILRIIEYYYLCGFFKTCDENGLRLPNVDLIRKHLFSKTHKNMQLVIGKEWIPYELIEIFALAQHYGMETRLLDWTTSIDIAIYFAVHKEPDITEGENVTEDSQYVAIWALDYSIENIIKQLKVVRPPFYGNPNLAAQRGLFTFWDNRIIEIPSYGETPEKYLEQIQKIKIDRTPLNVLVETELSRMDYSSIGMYKLMIPRRDKMELWNYLKKNKISSASLFPGYAGVVRSLDEDNTFE